MRRSLPSLIVLLSLVIGADARAQVQATEETVSSRTTSFRALTIEDHSPGAVTVIVNVGPAPGDDELGGFEERLIVVATSGFSSPAPSGCRRWSGDVDGDGRYESTGFNCPPQYDLLAIDTGDGDDQIDVYGDYPSLSRKRINSPRHAIFMNASMGEGRDTFVGGSGTDLVVGGKGRDRLHGGGGNDVLFGRGGRDFIFGDDGADLLIGGKGRDRLNGGPGTPDLMNGGPGRDRCRGNDADRVRRCEKLSLAAPGH